MAMVLQKTLSPAAWGALLVLSLLWGGSFLSNRLALESVGFLTTVAFRAAVASTVLWAWIIIRRLPLDLSPRTIGVLAVMGVLNNILPFSLIVWGQQHISSGLASILNSATTPLTVLLVAIFFADEKLTKAKLAGVGLGIIGVIVIVGPSVLHQVDLTSLGQLAVLGAATCYALSGAFARVALRGMRAEVAAAGMLTTAAIVLVPLALWQEGVPTAPISFRSWGGLIYLALFSSALAYLLYYRALDLAGAGNLSLVTIMIVPVAVALGAVVYGEDLPLRAYAGFGLIALGLLVLDGRIKWPRRTPPLSHIGTER